jgi:hypothetical protein
MWSSFPEKRILLDSEKALSRWIFGTLSQYTTSRAGIWALSQ